MDHRNERTSRSRIIFTGILLPALVAGPMIFAFYLYARRVMIDSHLAKAKAVCLTADSFNSSDGCKFADATSGDNSFDLTFTDRNSLNHMQLDDNVPLDFYEVDRSENLFLYMHFVKTRKTCLDCHGDPLKSKKLWANQNDRKELSGDLIGWSEGDVCGAYKVVASLSDSDRKVVSASVIAALLLLAGGSIITLGFCGVVNGDVRQRSNEERGNENDDENACLDSEIFDFDRVDKISERVH
jgi:hypothetical protein